MQIALIVGRKQIHLEFKFGREEKFARTQIEHISICVVS